MNHTTIANIRLANQQLSGTDFTTPKQIVSWMGAMQAQDFNMAKWAIGIRLPGYTEKEVEDAFNKGEFLRTHVMRPTWHIVAPEDIRWMLQLTAPRINSAMKSWGVKLGVTSEFCAKGCKIMQETLEGSRHLTREEMNGVLAANGLKADSSQISHLMMHAELCGLVCSGAMHGKKQTYALLEERAPTAKILPKDEALAKLARTYFTSHGPATLQDFVWWSGLSATDARHGLEKVKAGLVSEKSAEQVYWMADLPRPGSNDDSVHLLPAFDEYIISYRDRKAVLPAVNHHKAISSNGVFRPTVMKSGLVIGIWKKAITKSRIITSDLFAPADKPTQQSIDRAEEGFRQFLG